MAIKNNISTVDLARLAAFLDGEGIISIHRYHQKNHLGVRIRRLDLRIAITNTDIRLPLWCKETFGIGIIHVSDSRSKFAGQKQGYRWECNSRSGGQLLSLVRPYLLLKRDQADAALAFQSLMGGTNKLTSEMREKREAISEQIRELNRRGTVQKEIVI